MGACTSKETDSEKNESSRIDRELKEDAKRMSREVKLLLLGAGASGKSTVLKQMRFLHNKPFSADEVEDYRKIIFHNVVAGMEEIIDTLDSEGTQVEPQNRQYIRVADHEYPLRTDEPFPPAYLVPLQKLWADKAVADIWSRGYEYVLHENMGYFYKDLNRLWDPNYAPNINDVVRVRAKTTGISEYLFDDISGHPFRLLDVGGQRSERRKWVSCFENVTSVLFIASLSDYNTMIIEDHDANGMEETLVLWRSIINSPWFQKSSMILFLNKADLLMEKIKDPRQQVKRNFENFRGRPGSYHDAVEFFKEMFRGANLNPNKEIYTHITTATDSGALRVVMTAVTDTIVRNTLRDMHVL